MAILWGDTRYKSWLCLKVLRLEPGWCVWASIRSLTLPESEVENKYKLWRDLFNTFRLITTVCQQLG